QQPHVHLEHGWYAGGEADDQVGLGLAGAGRGMRRDHDPGTASGQTFQALLPGTADVGPPRNGGWPFWCQYTKPTPAPSPSSISSLTSRPISWYTWRIDP